MRVKFKGMIELHRDYQKRHAAGAGQLLFAFEIWSKYMENLYMSTSEGLIHQKM
jgi:hypothetical protein